jgi:bifunctional non-homologous end joining protein LigD
MDTSLHSARRPRATPSRTARFLIPDGREAAVEAGGRTVRLTNLDKPFWRDLGLTKRDLLQYYADVAHALLPHVAGRAMVMKRYPDGADGTCFFMKRAPQPRPEWIATCAIEHGSGSVIDFPIVSDLASLLWLVNLGCIDLNPWYARCDDVDATFAAVREAALVVGDALRGLGMTPFVKTTGSKGVHVYVAIVRGPLQKEVWAFAKAFAFALAQRHPGLLTAEYRIARRPAGRVLVDYNQNAWGRTLASVYSLRPKPRASASAPVTWDEVERGIEIADFRVDNLPSRLAEIGDLWAPLNRPRGRFDVSPLVRDVPRKG